MVLDLTDLVYLEYDPPTGVLYARWPDNSPLMVQYFEESFEAVLWAMNTYEVKYFLLDSSRNRNSLSLEHYLHIFTLLFSGLAQTSLQKMARLKSSFEGIESKYRFYNQEIINGIGIHFQVANFERREEAIAWLLANK
ncbi:hypothetical protein I5M27_17715 [Adhaeribacter sp. BT258]|uniref:SpoIIAA-like n=1 Tax=Adhaeribacter terrigena TaxID=2793070 RepID=A0ABS1C653_9BACT|nr:hypothetical protein [Adhaeribacter terrigena]MBK0404834.1 hypothetical protein [Adhaeribacter terrigena]